MSKLKVMHVLNTGGYSGAENVVITIINNTKDEVDSVYVSPDGTIKSILDKENIMFHPIDGTVLNIFSLLKALKEIKPDIVHAHDFTASILCFLTFCKIPVISHLHNNPPWIKKINIKSLVYYISSLKYKKILTVSTAVVEEFYFGKKLLNKTKVIGNPFDKKTVMKKASNYVIDEHYDLIFIGRLSEQKDPLLLIDIISELASEIKKLKVAIVGDGELKDVMIHRIKENNISSNITMYGFVDNPYPILNNSKILCMPSKWEGFGLVAVESLCLNKPVIACPVGGLINIVNDNCGKLCISKNEFVKEISMLLTDHDYYNTKKTGTEIQLKKFDNLEEYKLQLMHIYLESRR